MTTPQEVLDGFVQHDADGVKGYKNRIANQQSVCDSLAAEVARADSKIAELRQQLGESADTQEPHAVAV